MKYVLFLIMCWMGWFSAPSIKPLEAIQQRTMGGRPESGILTTYSIKIVAPASSEKLTFTKVFIEGNEIDFALLSSQKSNIKSFSKGDTLLLEVQRRVIDAQYRTEMVSETLLKSVIEDKSPAVVFYTYKNKEASFKVSEFKRLSNVELP
jgi:hypothetical protein